MKPGKLRTEHEQRPDLSLAGSGLCGFDRRNQDHFVVFGVDRIPASLMGCVHLWR
jgi:hypothetical protein